MIHETEPLEHVNPAGGALTVMWFRRDLRLRDNPALALAAESGTVLPLYILDDEIAGEWKLGGASRWWLHHSLNRLNESLDGGLWILEGGAERKLLDLCARLPVRKVVWNLSCDPWQRRQDEAVVSALRGKGVECVACNGSLLWLPRESGKRDGTPYAVFTPFYRNLSRLAQPGPPAPAPKALRIAACSQPASRIERLGLKPRIPWDSGLEQRWSPGEESARRQLRSFLAGNVEDYGERRDFPAEPATSSLSPHLHFGEVGPRQVWWDTHTAEPGEGRESFLRQLCWREFCHHMLYHYPQLGDENWRREFDRFPWREDRESLLRWQRGMTGIPWVDAGMRELRTTGTMHNRVRMAAASFLTKNLLIHWRHGARWFWDCLVDADLANNSFGWQWVAGSGADAAPYFRVFNPVLQSRKFDPQGEYLRRWLPELGRLANKRIHAPWEAGAAELRAADLSLGRDYPEPIVDPGESRRRALVAWQAMQQNRSA